MKARRLAGAALLGLAMAARADVPPPRAAGDAAPPRLLTAATQQRLDTLLQPWLRARTGQAQPWPDSDRRALLEALASGDDAPRFLRLLNGWLRLTAVLNELSRSMGQPDFYPFVMNAPAVAKLHLVHRVVTGAAAERPG
jgi:hypothetical protein